MTEVSTSLSRTLLAPFAYPRVQIQRFLGAGKDQEYLPFKAPNDIRPISECANWCLLDTELYACPSNNITVKSGLFELMGPFP
ncbi:hypothetical protein WG66_004463 [Moniliophthora roreri]|nr:hypothetical protein WG66_004463 [Moniliophthora roreri]